jgi:hypothetical protein
MPRNREKDRAYQKIYRETHRDEIRARLAAKSEYISARNKKYREANSEERRANRKANCRTPQGRFGILRGNARARNLTLELTFEQWSNIVAQNSCAYCEGPLPEAGSGVDRKISILGYTAENCVPCCTVCNRIRGKDDISHEEMFEVVKLLNTLRSK